MPLAECLCVCVGLCEVWSEDGALSKTIYEGNRKRKKERPLRRHSKRWLFEAMFEAMFGTMLELVFEARCVARVDPVLAAMAEVIAESMVEAGWKRCLMR